MKKVSLKNKEFVIFLTGNEEKIAFDEMYDFELEKKQAEQRGDGYRCWLEVVHNDELLIIGLD